MTLANLSIGHNQSARWQRQAAVPDEVFEEYLAAAKASGEQITAKGLLRFCKDSNVQQINTETKQDGAPICPLHHSAATALEEIQHHTQLLERILAPLCQDQIDELPPGEKRLTLRLLREMAVSIGSVEKFWHTKEISVLQDSGHAALKDELSI